MSDILVFILGIIAIIVLSMVAAALCVLAAIKHEIERGDDK